MIRQWDEQMRARWDSLSVPDRAIIRADLLSYGEIPVEPGAREDAEAALLFLDGWSREAGSHVAR